MTRFQKFIRLISSVVLMLFGSGCSNSIPLVSNDGHPIVFNKNSITSLKALKEQNLIMQHYDYSCGAASLATLMRYYFNDNVSEKSILDYIKETFSEQEFSRVEEDGLSFLELEKISRSLGYQSASVRLKIPVVSQLSGPVIVYLQTKLYRHFVVLRGVKGGTVFIADPSRGNLRLPIDEFKKVWHGETFVLGKKGFGTPQMHQLAILLETKSHAEINLLRQVLFDYPRTRKPRLQ